MALAAWRREAHPWRLTALFFLLAGGLGGLVLALGLASGSVAAYVGRLYRAEISWPVLLGAALGFFGLLHLVFRQAARHGGGETQPYPSEDRVVPCGCCTTRETPCEAPSPDSRCWCWSRRRWAGFCRRRWNES